MAKKAPNKKSLKSLFTKRDNSESPKKDEDKTGEEKKSKFFKFKIKSKTATLPDKPANENRRVVSAVDPDKTAEYGDAWPDISSPDSKRASLYGTAPRSKVKDYSSSETDLRKKSGGFFLSFRKNKKKDEEGFSKSTTGLHRPANKEQKEEPLDLRQMPLDQTKKTATYSMSHPELETTSTLNMPSPALTATNQSASFKPLTSQSQSSVPLNKQPESKEPSMDFSGPSGVGKEMRRAPIATISELQWDERRTSIPSVEKEKINKPSQGLYSSSASTTPVVSISAVDTAPSIPVSKPLTVLGASDHKAAVPESVSASVGLSDEYVLQQSDIKSNISLSETTSGTLSLGQPAVPEKADNAAPSGDTFLAAVDSKVDAIISEPSLDSSAFNTDSATPHNQVSISCVERSIPETTTGVTTTVTLGATGENSIPSANKTVHGALYESLFPQTFASEILSSASNSSPVSVSCGLSADGHTQGIHLDTESDPVMVENLNECHTETNTIDSSLSATSESEYSAPRVDISSGLSGDCVFQKSDIQAGPEMAENTVPSGDSRLAAVDSKMDTITTKPSTDDTDSATFHNEESVSRVETSVPETITSATTTVTSVTAGGISGMPTSSETAMYGVLYESLFPQTFVSEVLSSTSNPGLTEKICLDTNTDPIMIQHCTEGDITEQRGVSVTPESESSAPRMDNVKDEFTDKDTNVTKTEVTEGSSSIPKTKKHAFSTLYESLHLPSSTMHQTPSTPDLGQLPTATQTDSALHHENPTSCESDSTAPRVDISSDLSGDYVLQQANIKADTSLSETTSGTFTLGQPEALEIADNTAPSDDSSLAAVDSTIDAVIASPDSSAFNTDFATLHNEESISCVETCIPETVTSATTAVTSVTTGESSVPSSSKTAMYGSLYESLFPPSFASEVLSSTSNSGLTERIHLDTNTDPITTPCQTGSNITEQHSVSVTHESDSTANVTKTEVTSSTESSTTIPKTRKHAFSALYESLHLLSPTTHQTPSTPDAGQLHSATQTDSALHHENPPSSLNLNSEPVGQDISDTDNIPHSAMTLITDSCLSATRESDSAAPRVDINTGVSGDYVLQQSNIKGDTSLSETTSDTLMLSQPNAHETADNTAPSGNSSLTAVDAVIASPDTSAFNTDSATLHNEESISCVETCIPETVTSATTAVTSVTTGESSVPSSSKTAMYGSLYESLFPPSFASEVLSSTSNSGLTERIHLDTNTDPITTPCQTGSNITEQHSVSVTHESDSTANVTKTEVTSSTESSTTIPKTRKHAFSALYESLHLLSPTTHQTPSTPDAGQLHSATQTDSALHHENPPSSLNLNSEPVGQDISDTDNVPHSAMTLITDSCLSATRESDSAAISRVETSFPETITTVTTTVTSVTTGDHSLSATHESDSTAPRLDETKAGCTNIDAKVTKMEVTSSNEASTTVTKPKKHAFNALYESLHLSSSTLHQTLSTSDPEQLPTATQTDSVLHHGNDSESDSSELRMDNVKADFTSKDANVTKREVTPPEVSITVTKPKKHAFSALYESLHLTSSTLHQTPSTSDPEPLPTATQTDSVLYHGNAPSPLSLNVEPAGQGIIDTDNKTSDNIPPSEMTLSDSGMKSANFVHTEKIQFETSSDTVKTETLNACQTESIITDSNLSAASESDTTAPRIDNVKADFTNKDASITKAEVTSSTEGSTTVTKPKKYAFSAFYESLHLTSSPIHQTPSIPDPGLLPSATQTDSALHHGNPPSTLNLNIKPLGQEISDTDNKTSDNIPHSEMNLSDSGIKIEKINFETSSDTVTESRTETSIADRSPSATHESGSTVPRMDDRKADFTNTDASKTKTAVTSTAQASSTVTTPKKHAFNALYDSLFLPSFSRHQPPTTSDPLQPLSSAQTGSALYHGQSISNTDNTIASVQNSAPPISHNVRSPGADTQVPTSKQRAVFVRVTDTNLTSADPACPSPMLETMAAKGPETEVETVKEETFSVPVGQIDGDSMPHNPVFVSLGSDDGSAMDVYYSAEEDNVDDSGHEEMYTLDDREGTSLTSSVVDEVAIPQQEKMAEREQTKNLINQLEVRGGGGKLFNEDKAEHLDSQPEIQHKLRGHRAAAEGQKNGTSVFLEDSDVRKEEQVSTKARPRMKEKGEEERKEELLATPVQQVNTLKECESALPSSKPHGQGEGSEGNWTTGKHIETEDHPNRKTQLPGVSDRRAEITYSASGNTVKEGIITYALTGEREKIDCQTSRQPKELLTAQAEKTGEESKASIPTNSSSTESVKSTFTVTSVEDRHSAITGSTGKAEVVRGTLSHSAELQSDARGTEHNRAAQRSKWADTVTQSTTRASPVPEQVADELSVTSTDTHHPDREAADALLKRDDRPPAAHPSPPQGSLNASGVLRQALEVCASKIQQANSETADTMTSGYSTLSTTLSIKPSIPTLGDRDETTTRFHKVSLINETDSTTGLSQDTVDFSKPSTQAKESNRTDLLSVAPEYKWKNRFEGVSQCRPAEESSLSDSLNSSMYNTHSGSSPAVYTKHLLTSSSSYPSPSQETYSSLGNRLTDRTGVYLSRESEPEGTARTGEWWRGSVREREELVAPAGEREGRREREAEPEKINSGVDSQLSSSLQTSRDDRDGSCKEDDSIFSGVFTATRVELITDVSSPTSSPISPDINSPLQCEMDSLVDTLKSMGPSQKVRNKRQGNAQVLVPALPPIDENAPASAAPVTSPTTSPPAPGAPPEAPNGLYSLPPDIGLNWSTPKDKRSPSDMMKQSQQDQQQPGNRGLNFPSRASAAGSLVMRKFSDSSNEDSPDGNGVLQPSSTGSRLDNSVLFSSYRSASLDKTHENGKANPLGSVSLFRSGSLPEIGSSFDRMSTASKEFGGFSTGTDKPTSRFDRLSFLTNSSLSPSSSLHGTDDANARMSMPLPLSLSSPPSNSPTRLLSPTGSIDLHRVPFGQTQGMGMGAGTGALGTPVLQRSFSSDGALGVQQVQSPLFNSVHGGSHFQAPEPEPDRNLMSKYRAFPDAYLTKEKEHGKLNPRPGKMYIFDRTGMCGQRIEVRSDVIDATPWQLQETISIRVVRGGWVLYEKPNFKGEKIALDEGDIELTCPFNPPEEEEQPLQNGQKENGEQNNEQNGEKSGEQTEDGKPARRFIIGSIRRAVRDYSVPDISLFPEQNAEGKKVIFRDTSDDARIFGFPIKANSIIINAGLWLVYAQPFFQGVPRVLEVGGYPSPEAWGVEHPYVGSLHPLKIGEPRVENVNDPKIVIYEKPYFTGKSRTITTNTRDFMTRTSRQQTTFMYNLGSLKVLGGIWVGYEKEGFRGHQYLLEEGEYHDWRVWGGCDSELRSVRIIQADLTDPLMVMFEQPEEEQDEGQDENTFEVTEAIPDVELFGFKTTTRSIHVLSGAWIAYSHVDFSGDQYILEKGFYNNCADWGSDDNRICSVQPILLAPGEKPQTGTTIMLYGEPDFQGECHICSHNDEAVSDKLLAKSCRVAGGSWVLYDAKQFSGNLYVLSEGEYPNFASMGCPTSCTIRSVKAVPLMFSVPSISLFGLECLEGREITTDVEVPSMVEDGFNNHVLSVRVNSGCWVLCEYSNFRGRQFLLEPIEITNWPKFSSLSTIGSMYPVRQKRRFFRIKNKEKGHYMSIQGGVEEMKTGRVVVTPQIEAMSDIWYYQEGLIKNKMAPTMSLQVMGNIEPAAKVVLWSETRQPIQSWKCEMQGTIISLTFPNMILDVKGGKTYDKDHVVIMPESEDRPSQQWELELI